MLTGFPFHPESAFAPHYSTAVNLWHRPEDRDLLADLYARSLRRFQHDTRLEELTRRFKDLQRLVGLPALPPNKEK